MKRLFGIALSALVLVGFSHRFVQQGMENVPVGECRCTSETDGGSQDTFIKDYCIYQAHEYGDEIFSRLVAGAYSLVREFTDPTQATLPQRGAKPRTIQYWFPKKESRDRVCSYLKTNDSPYLVQKPVEVSVKATMYSFEKGYERNLGMDLGVFLGNRSVQEQIPEVSGGFAGGLLNLALGIGNPLASLLSGTLRAAADKRETNKITEITFRCNMGQDCRYSHQAQNLTNGVVNTIQQNTGLIVSLIPRLDPNNPSLIELGDLVMEYAVQTDPKKNPNAPVDRTQIINGRDVVLRPGDIYIVSSESAHIDFKKGQYFQSGSGHVNNQFIVLVEAQPLLPNGTAATLKQQLGMNDLAVYSTEELNQLPNGQLALKDILSSIELVCFENVFDPASFEQICGFKASKMDRRFIDQKYRLKFTIDGRVKNKSERNKTLLLSEIFDGKGYYALPKLDSGRSADFTLSVQLDDSTQDGRDKRQAEAIKGIKIRFAYYPGSQVSVVVQDPSKWEYITK